MLSILYPLLSWPRSLLYVPCICIKALLYPSFAFGWSDSSMNFPFHASKLFSAPGMHLGGQDLHCIFFVYASKVFCTSYLLLVGYNLHCIYILLGAFFWNTGWYFLRVLKVFDEPLGESNTERQVKSISRYFKRRHLIIYLLSNSKKLPLG